MIILPGGGLPAPRTPWTPGRAGGRYFERPGVQGGPNHPSSTHRSGEGDLGRRGTRMGTEDVSGCQISGSSGPFENGQNGDGYKIPGSPSCPPSLAFKTLSCSIVLEP